MKRLSIRDQLLLPLVVVQAIAVAAASLWTATLAAQRAEKQIIDRVNGVVATLGQASFPYTPRVLSQLGGLSGAQFVAFDKAGRVLASSLEGLTEKEQLPPGLRVTERLESLSKAPSWDRGGVRYLAARIEPSRDPRGPSLLVLYPETTWRQARSEAAWPPALLGGGSLAMMAGLTALVAHRMGRRIRVLQRQVARIADGDFQEIDPGPTGDEVRELADSINRMCVRLRESQDTLRRNERTRLLAQFAAGLAHQLRNSLTGARLSVQLHARRCGTAGTDGSLDVALRQLAMTEEQVKGLLSLGRVEQRPREVADLRELCDGVADLVGPACEHSRVAFELRGQDSPNSATVDVSGVRSAILNLTLNAIDAARPGGHVSLGLVEAPESLIIEVVDDGPGPPERLAESLGETFVTGKPEGVGLGLALARQVAAEHGGRLEWSRADGLTTFRLMFPRETVCAEEAAWVGS